MANINNVDCILTADWHLRLENIPKCRTDDFLSAQWQKMEFVSKLQAKYKCPVLHAGDLFDRWKASPFLLSETIRRIPKDFMTIYGNHDLAYHNIDYAFMTGLRTLEEAGIVDLLSSERTYFNKDKDIHIMGCSFGQIPKPPSLEAEHNVLVWHVMAYQEHNPPYPGITSPTALAMLKKYPEYQLILTGDNHTPFVETYEGRILVNPGSLMRQTAAQIDFKPRVYLWDSKTNTVEPVYIPIVEGVVSNDHIVNERIKNERLEDFVNKLDSGQDFDLDFASNVKEYIERNEVVPHVAEIVLKSLEGSK